MFFAYCQISNISRTKSQHLNVGRLGLQLSLSNSLKPGVKSIMKMSALLQLHTPAIYNHTIFIGFMLFFRISMGFWLDLNTSFFNFL